MKWFGFFPELFSCKIKKIIVYLILADFIVMIAGLKFDQNFTIWKIQYRCVLSDNFPFPLVLTFAKTARALMNLIK